MKIAMGCDHGGFHLKEHIKKYLQDKGIEVVDHGTYSEDSVDYPDFAEKLCKDITSGESGAERGILICGTGIGISIAANKCKGIRERVLGVGLAEMITDAWLNTEFAGGRHERRVDKIMALEAK